MTEEKLQYYKDKLLTKRKEVREQLETYGHEDPTTGAYETTYTDVGDDYDENAYEVTTFGRNQRIERTLKDTLEQIERALQRIEDGTYGICQKTGEPISEERLEVLPEAEESINAGKGK